MNLKLIILYLSLALTNWIMIKYYIERHSVHPVYSKVVEASMKCSPWDSCD